MPTASVITVIAVNIGDRDKRRSTYVNRMKVNTTRQRKSFCYFCVPDGALILAAVEKANEVLSRVNHDAKQFLETP